MSAFGRIDTLINNVAISDNLTIRECSLADFLGNREYVNKNIISDNEFSWDLSPFVTKAEVNTNGKQLIMNLK